MAGRNLNKLEAVRAEIAADFPEAAELPLVVADVEDVTVSTPWRNAHGWSAQPGPYARLGDLLVEACVANGTDYCDLTGEVHWMRKNIDDHHETARSKQCRIVHAAGFDSIPGHWCVRHSTGGHRTVGHPAPVVRTTTGKIKGGFSGGTVASMALIFI